MSTSDVFRILFLIVLLVKNVLVFKMYNFYDEQNDDRRMSAICDSQNVNRATSHQSVVHDTQQAYHERSEEVCISFLFRIKIQSKLKFL